MPKAEGIKWGHVWTPGRKRKGELEEIERRLVVIQEFDGSSVLDRLWMAGWRFLTVRTKLKDVS